MSKMIAKIEELIIAVVLAVMSIITFLNVITRNFIQYSLSYTEEITINLFVLLTFVGAAIGVRRGAHFGFTLILEKSPANYKKIFDFIYRDFIGIRFYHSYLFRHRYDHVSVSIRFDHASIKISEMDFFTGNPIRYDTLHISYNRSNGHSVQGFIRKEGRNNKWARY